MFTVEYFWEVLFPTAAEAEAFAEEVGPVYGECPRVIPVAS